MALSVSIADFRAAIIAKLEAELPNVPRYDQVIQSVNEVPSIVLGFPEIELDQVARNGVLRLEQQVFIVGNRQDAGETEAELIDLANQVFVIFGGGRAVKEGTVNLTANYCRPRTLTVAGDPYNMYDIQLETESVNC